METRKMRLSGIELLKVIAIILIIFSHTVPSYGTADRDAFIDLNFASSDFKVAVLSYFIYFGQIGNAIFIVCSAYFLLDSKLVKGQKILYIIADSFIISVVYLCSFLIAGYSLTTAEILLQFIPIISRFSWFIGCYLIMYAVHPLLNKIIYSTQKRNLLLFNIFLFVMYSVFEFVGGDEMNMFYYTHLVGFICLYFYTGYVKLHMQNILSKSKLQAVILALSIAGLTGLFALTEYVGLKVDALSDKMNHWDEINNPFMIGIAFSSFALFSKLKFQNRFINYLSSLSLIVYMIHENKLFRSHFKPRVFDFIYEKFSYTHIVGWCVLLVIATFIIAGLLSALYKETVGKLIKRAIDKIYPSLASAGNKLTDRLAGKDE